MYFIEVDDIFNLLISDVREIYSIETRKIRLNLLQSILFYTYTRVFAFGYIDKVILINLSIYLKLIRLNVWTSANRTICQKGFSLYIVYCIHNTISYTSVVVGPNGMIGPFYLKALCFGR